MLQHCCSLKSQIILDNNGRIVKNPPIVISKEVDNYWSVPALAASIIAWLAYM